MIGGHDISFPTQAPAAFVDGAIRHALIVWKEALLEDADTGELLDGDFVGVPVPREIFIYKNSAARDSWAKNGAVSENANSMIHMIRGAQSVTLVVDDPRETDMRVFLDAMRDYFKQDLFWMRAVAA